MKGLRHYKLGKRLYPPTVRLKPDTTYPQWRPGRDRRTTLRRAQGRPEQSRGATKHERVPAAAGGRHREPDRRPQGMGHRQVRGDQAQPRRLVLLEHGGSGHQRCPAIGRAARGSGQDPCLQSASQDPGRQPPAQGLFRGHPQRAVLYCLRRGGQGLHLGPRHAGKNQQSGRRSAHAPDRARPVAKSGPLRVALGARSRSSPSPAPSIRAQSTRSEVPHRAASSGATSKRSTAP
jgi:hypothetical protein